MILIIESDETVRKKLSDLLSRERIIGIGSVQQALEMICKYRDTLNIIITDIHQLHEIISKKIVFRLCDKLHVDTPPMVGIYRNGDEEIKKKLEQKNIGYKLLKYNNKDCSFPEQYIEVIKEVYPGVHADVEKAREIWMKEKKDDDLVDIRKWIKEEGFFIEENKEVYISKLKEKHRKNAKEDIGDIEELGLLLEEPGKKQELKSKKGKKKNYKKMYFEIKRKYDELLKYVKELADSV